MSVHVRVDATLGYLLWYCMISCFFCWCAVVASSDDLSVWRHYIPFYCGGRFNLCDHSIRIWNSGRIVANWWFCLAFNKQMFTLFVLCRIQWREKKSCTSGDFHMSLCFKIRSFYVKVLINPSSWVPLSDIREAQSACGLRQVSLTSCEAIIKLRIAHVLIEMDVKL